MTSVVNVVCDFYVLLLPLYRITQLQLSFKRKLGLIVVFAWGLAYVIPSFVMRV